MAKKRSSKASKGGLLSGLKVKQLLLGVLALVGLAALARFGAGDGVAPAVVESKSLSDFHRLSAKTLEGDELAFSSLADSVTLVVNVASQVRRPLACSVWVSNFVANTENNCCSAALRSSTIRCKRCEAATSALHQTENSPSRRPQRSHACTIQLYEQYESQGLRILAFPCNQVS